MSHPHGCVSWNNEWAFKSKRNYVTPSRVCELKLDSEFEENFYASHTLTGVWVEIVEILEMIKDLIVTPSRVCELKCILSKVDIETPSVTPSRVCELKYADFAGATGTGRSHPHGCVSWNIADAVETVVDRSHTLTGVWVEIEEYFDSQIANTVTPSRVCELKCQEYSCCFTPPSSHPHGCVSWNRIKDKALLFRHVTPSRVCELKSAAVKTITAERLRHTLTGVWVEMQTMVLRQPRVVQSHPHGCVSWNRLLLPYPAEKFSHTLTGVWVDIFRAASSRASASSVTPSRVCELKFELVDSGTVLCVTPSRVCELKSRGVRVSVIVMRHTLTGVWVEITRAMTTIRWRGSHPHGCVSWNNNPCADDDEEMVTPSRVCELKFGNEFLGRVRKYVTPSRVCELKCE